MGRIGLAFKTFFSILGDQVFAERVRQLAKPTAALPADIPNTTPAVEVKPPAAPVKPAAPAQNPAVTLLETLQREGRLIDFLQEPLDGYADAQVGAAVREIHRGCRAVIDRCFGIVPVVEQQEGSTITLTQPVSAAVYKILGGGPGTGGTIQGTLVHAGWRVARTELPQFQGDKSTAEIIAPAEVEVR